MQQRKISDIRRPDCPFSDRLEDEDDHCNTVGISLPGYDMVGEDSEDFALSLAAVNGVAFDDITIANPANPELPRYFPTIPRGSRKLFTEYTPDFVAVSVKDVISAKQMRVTKDVHKLLGVPKETKVILLGFGKDALIEPMWPPEDRERIITELNVLDLYTVVPPNYSIWDDQPHAERLINEKRSLIMYRDLIEVGLTAIPHVYWYGRKDLDEWVKFLARHPEMRTVCIDMQTLGRESDWQRAVDDLRYFAARLGSDMHFLVVGPSTPARIEQIIKTLPNVSLTNGMAAQGAVHRRLLNDDLSKVLMLDVEKTDIMRTNDMVIKELVDKLTAALEPDVLPAAAHLRVLKNFS